MHPFLFSIPAVKGVEFGSGFDMARSYGSVVNDSLYYDNGEVKLKTNHNGGINGGISNGFNVTIRVAIKPTPSIAKEQQTVDFIKGEEVKISIKGRHDPCIVHRARVVVDSIVAFTLADILVGRFGTEYLR